MNYPGYPNYQAPAAPSFQPQVAPTPPQYVITAPAAKGSKSIPVKARPTAEKASTRKVSAGDQTGNNAAVQQTKDLISDADEFAEYNGTSQSFAGYSYKQNEDKFYNMSTKHEDDKNVFPGRNDSSSFKNDEFAEKEKESNDISENDSVKKAEKEESQNKEQKSSDEPDYKDEIEKEAVEQEKQADRKAEEEEGHHDDNDDDDDDDDDEDDDSDDEDDEDEPNDDEDEDLKSEGHSPHDNTRQKDDINNPAEQSFAVSPTVLPGMCPPCRK